VKPNGQVMAAGTRAVRPASTQTCAAMIAAKPRNQGPSASERAAEAMATSVQPASHIRSSIRASGGDG
jgi:hypothetical protein